MKKALVAGTFDHLHAGHHALLNAAIKASLDQPLTLLIGLTADGPLLANKAHSVHLEKFDKRKQNIEIYLEKNAPKLDVNIFPNSTTEGPLLTDPDIELLVCSNEPKVLKVCKGIQQQRKQIDMPELKLLIVPCIKPASSTQKISSSQIRAQLAKTAAETQDTERSNSPKC